MTAWNDTIGNKYLKISLEVIFLKLSIDCLDLFKTNNALKRPKQD